MGTASGAGATEKAGPAHAAGPERFTSALALRVLPELGLVVRFLLPLVLLPTDWEPAHEGRHAALVNTRRTQQTLPLVGQGLQAGHNELALHAPELHCRMQCLMSKIHALTIHHKGPEEGPPKGQVLLHPDLTWCAGWVGSWLACWRVLPVCSCSPS